MPARSPRKAVVQDPGPRRRDVPRDEFPPRGWEERPDPEELLQLEEVQATRARVAREEAEAKRALAEAGRAEREDEKIAGEVAQQPGEERERELRIEEAEVRILRAWFWILGPPLALAIGLILGLDAGSVTGAGEEFVLHKLTWLPK